MRKTRAFTLIELLTVMAITAVLLTLIVVPIIQSFALTRSAQAFADAQDKGRSLTDRIAREVGNAVSVRDAASTIAIVPNGPGLSGTQEILLPYTKLDLIPPAQGDPSQISKNADGSITYIDPNTGKKDPTLTRPKGDVNLSGVPGPTIVRWFVGLNRPFKADGTVASYNEPYTGLLMARNGDQDNLYVLRRIEVQPFLYRTNKNTPKDQNTLAWRPNLKFFRSNDATDKTDDTRIIDLDDPKFFVPDGMYLLEGSTTRMADPNKNARVAAWASASTIQTEISRYDMIRPLLQGSPPMVVKDGMGRVSVVPLVQFRPTRVANEPAAGSAAARPGVAVDGLDRIGPDTFRTDRGLWTDAIVRYYPAGYAPTSDPTALSGLMEVASVSTNGDSVITQGVADAGGLDTPTGTALFDLRGYERGLAAGVLYPFTAAVQSAAVTTEGRQFFTPFRAITATGKIVTSFPIDQVGDATQTGTQQPNLPVVSYTGMVLPMSPYAAAGSKGPPIIPPGDPNLSTAPYSPYGVARGDYDVNRAYNRAFVTYPDLQGTMQRFIDLRFVPNADGTLSPLCPETTAGVHGFTVAAGNGGTLNRVRIVPGSDEVYGPDQTGNAYGGPTVRYTRTTGNPGPNQYRLVYADLPEPTNANGQVDYSASLLSAGGVNSADLGAFNPANYDATNVVSAVFQPRFKAGYLQLDSDANVPLPSGAITVSYRFQFNGPSDTFAVDLDTREVMQILLTIKNYPQSTAPNAQAVTLKSTATLRNALR